MRLATQSVRVWRAGPPIEDDYHNQIPGPATSHDIVGCSVQPGAGAEFTTDRSATTTVWTIWADPTADVLDDDEVEYPIDSGRRYNIDGPVDRWHVGSNLDHLVIRLRRGQG